MFDNTDKKNAFWNSLSFVFMAVTTFIGFTFIIKTYDTETLGLFFIINSIFGLSNTFDFGFGVSAIKHISEFRSKKEKENINSFLVTYLLAFIFLACLILVILTIYFYIFIFNSGIAKKIEGFETNTIFIILALAFFTKYLANYMRNIMEGFAEFKKLSIMNIVVSVLNLLTSFIIFLFKFDIIYLAIFTFSVNFCSFLIFSYYLFANNNNNNKVSLNLKYFSYNTLKKYSVYGINIQAASFVQTFLDPMIKYLLGRYLSLSSVTFFETSKKVVDFTTGLIFSAQKGILNKLSESNIKGNLKKFVNENLYIYSKMANYYSIFTYGILNIFICFVIMFLFGYRDAVIIYLILILTYSLINYGGSLYSTFMVQGKGMILLLLQIINILSTFAFLFISLQFIKGYFGLIGFYFATILSVIILFYNLKKYFDFNYKSFIKITKLYHILLMNFLNLINISIILSYEKYFVLIQILFFIVYLIVFRKYVKYFYDIIKDKLISKKIINIIKD